MAWHLIGRGDGLEGQAAYRIDIVSSIKVAPWLRYLKRLLRLPIRV